MKHHQQVNVFTYPVKYKHLLDGMTFCTDVYDLHTMNPYDLHDHLTLHRAHHVVLSKIGKEISRTSEHKLDELP